MALLQYIGPFGKNGQVILKTRVVVQCECGYAREVSWESYRKNGDICAYCSNGKVSPLTPEATMERYPFISDILSVTRSGLVGQRCLVVARCGICGYEFEQLMMSIRHNACDSEWQCEMCRKLGPPRTPEIVFSVYSRVRDILSISSRNHVSNADKVVVCCSECEREFIVHMQGVSRQPPHYWRCVDCGRESIQKYGIPPDDLPSEIHRVEHGTLGNGNKVVDSTIVCFSCLHCGSEIRQKYGNYLRSSKLCKSCNTAIRWEDEEYRSWYSCMMEEKWQDENTRRAFLDGRSNDNGFLSKVHQDLKGVLSDIGINTFLSEMWVCDYKYRVDELDEYNKLAIEVYGDFWHASHVLYNDDDYVELPGGGDYARNIRQRDEERISEIESLGYSVYIVWENDIKNNKEWLVNDLLEWYYN